MHFLIGVLDCLSFLCNPPILVVLLQFSNLRFEKIRFRESDGFLILLELTELFTQLESMEFLDATSFEDLYEGLLGCLKQKDLFE